VALRLVHILSQRVDSTRVEGWDVWIEPDLEGIKVFDFDRTRTLVEAGYEATYARLPQIRRALGLPPEPLEVPPPMKPPIDLDTLCVRRIDLSGRRMSYGWVPREELGLAPGSSCSLRRIERGLRRLYATYLYDTVWPSFRMEDGEIVIDLELEERDPTFVSVNLLYDNGRNMNTSLEIARRNLLRLGEAAYLKAYLGNFLSGLEGGVRSSHVRGLPLAFDLVASVRDFDYRRNELGALHRQLAKLELSTGLLVGRDALVLFGARTWEDDGEGTSEVEEWSAFNRTVFGTVLVDGTDQRDLPSRGSFLRADYELYLGGDLESRLHAITAEGTLSVPLGNLSLTPKATGAWLSRDDAPFRNWHRLDLTRSTWGRFERGLYAPYHGAFGADLSWRGPYQIVLWASGMFGGRTTDFDLLRTLRPRRGFEGGILQRSPIGPILVGVAAEQGRDPHYFVQVGHDSIR
jgi:hypothetical protein